MEKPQTALEPPGSKWRRSWRAFRPYLPFAATGMAALVAAGLIEYPPWEALRFSAPIRSGVAGGLRAIGGAALVGSVIAPFVTGKVQQNVNQRLLQKVFDTLLDVHVPDWFARPIAKYLESIQRVTNFRKWRLTITALDVDPSILSVQVESTGHGFNISKANFYFEDLWAPASTAPYQTAFERVDLVTFPRGDLHRLQLDGQLLQEVVEEEFDGRRRVDLRSHREEAVVRPDNQYMLEQKFIVYLPVTWAYLLESFGAHKGQSIQLAGPALADLDIRVLHANQQLEPRKKKDGSLLYTISEPTFPGQTTVLSWKPAPPDTVAPSIREQAS